MANTYLTKTFSSDTTAGRRKWTWSAWVKRCKLGSDNWLFTAYSDGNNENSIFFDSSDRLCFSIYEGGNNTNGRLTSSRKFRDTAAWYHIVVVWDSANSTATDRMIIYVNGVRETAYDTNTNGGSNHQTLINKSGVEHSIGRYGSGTYYFDGIMSHVHFVDGTAYDASTFGSTDATTGEWKINTSPTLTMGTNGFTILKDGNTITDQSGNSNNFTASGTLTNTEDCPSNVFATLNPLTRQVAAQLASSPTNGNTTLTSGSGSAWGTLLSTIGASSGKYYCEAKLITEGSYARLGICDMSVSQKDSADTWFVGQTSGSAQYGINSANGNIYTNAGDSSYANSFTDGDIIGIAMDLDNSKLYFSKNGTWQNSGVPTSGSTGTGAQSITADKTYGFAISGYASTVWNVNFGNGYFSTTSISSEGTNASGIGKFEYDVPTGYTALSTKGLNE